MELVLPGVGAVGVGYADPVAVAFARAAQGAEHTGWYQDPVSGEVEWWGGTHHTR